MLGLARRLPANAVLLALLTLFLPAAAQAQETASQDDARVPFPIYRLELSRDVPIIAFDAAVWITYLIMDRSDLLDPCFGRFGPTGVCVSSNVNSFDRGAIGRLSAAASDASDITRAFAVAWPLVLEGIMLARPSRDRLKGALLDAFVVSEVISITGGLTLVLEHATERLRPKVYRQGPIPVGMLRDRNDFLSFPSGHTSSAFAVSTAGCVTYVRRMRPSLGRAILACGPGAAASIATAWLRVEAGRHFPTDVIAGAGLGAGVAIVVPLLHRDPREGARGFALPLVIPYEGGAMFALHGMF